MAPDFITTAEAAERLGYTVQHVRRLVRETKLSGEKRGRDWLVSEASVRRFEARDELLDLPLRVEGGGDEG